ncbi:MAG: PEP-CTERM sorting domain-containing protein [Tepidisphaeraceae bacterium]
MKTSKNNFRFVAASVAIGATGLLCASSVGFGAVEVVNGFGVDNWTSWDTRNTSGTQLVGSNDTNAAGPAYFGVPASSADDTAIQQQIIFMGEGQTVNDAAGNTPPASPTGSLNGLGYVRLDGTSSNSGKSDISYVNTSGIAPASDLTSDGFSASYTFFSQSNPTSREPGLNISVIGTDSVQYTFAYTPNYTANAWNTESASSSSGVFTVHSSDGENGATGTLAELAADPTYGSLMFGGGAEIWRVGFNIGSGQRSCLVYLDDVQTSLLNGGDVIDFQGASVPEPASFSLLGIGALALLRRRHRA